MFMKISAEDQKRTLENIFGTTLKETQQEDKYEFKCGLCSQKPKSSIISLKTSFTGNNAIKDNRTKA